MVDELMSEFTQQRSFPAVGAADPLRVLLWSPKGAGRHYSGPGTSAYRLYSRRNHRTVNVSLAHGYVGQARESEVFEWESLVYPLFDNHDGLTLKAGLQGAIAQARFLAAGRRWLSSRAGDFDIFHGLTGYHYTVDAAGYAAKLGVPSFVKIAGHNADIARRFGWRDWFSLSRLRRRTLCRLSGVIAISSDIARELVEARIPERMIAAIPNGVDVERFHPCDSQAERAQLRLSLGWVDRPTVLFVGGVVPRKQPHLIVEALGTLVRRGVDCQVVLVGPEHDRPYAASIRALSADLGLSHRVIWNGIAPDVATVYRASDVFCLPSRGEGLANALLEAMASALPSVVIPVSGSRDLVVPGETGEFAESSKDSLATALEVYLRDNAMAARHGIAARLLTVDRYSADAVLSLHLRLFHTVLRGGHPADVAPIL